MDTPERIWATWKEDFGAVQIGTWSDTIRFEPMGLEYVRADLLTAAEAALAEMTRSRDLAQSFADRCADVVESAVAERCEELAAERDRLSGRVDEMSAERDAALAQVERLRIHVERLLWVLMQLRKKASATRGDQAYRELPSFVVRVSSAAIAEDAKP